MASSLHAAGRAVRRLDQLCDWRHDAGLKLRLEDLFPSELMRVNGAFADVYRALADLQSAAGHGPPELEVACAVEALEALRLRARGVLDKPGHTLMDVEPLQVGNQSFWPPAWRGLAYIISMYRSW